MFKREDGKLLKCRLFLEEVIKIGIIRINAETNFANKIRPNVIFLITVTRGCTFIKFCKSLDILVANGYIFENYDQETKI